MKNNDTIIFPDNFYYKTEWVTTKPKFTLCVFFSATCISCLEKSLELKRLQTFFRLNQVKCIIIIEEQTEDADFFIQQVKLHLPILVIKKEDPFWSRCNIPLVPYYCVINKEKRIVSHGSLVTKKISDLLQNQFKIKIPN